MSFYVYIIKTINSKVTKSYVGYTNNLKKRLSDHNNNKGAKSTKGHKWELIYKKKFNINHKFEFKHGKKYLLPDNKILIACYHPSPRNVNTKVVTHAMINSLFKKAKKISKL